MAGLMVPKRRLQWYTQHSPQMDNSPFELGITDISNYHYQQTEVYPNRRQPANHLLPEQDQMFCGSYDRPFSPFSTSDT